MSYRLFVKIFEIAGEKMCFEIREFLKKGEKVLDLGCGSGVFTQKVQNKFGVEIIGIDVMDCRIFKVPFRLFDGKRIPFSNGAFDTVLISFVLHHTENPVELLNEARRVGKKIIIFEDLFEPLLGKLRCYIHWFLWNLIFKKKFSKFNFYSEKEWEEIFKKLNLRLIAKKDFVVGFKFIDPVKKKIFVLENSLQV